MLRNFTNRLRLQNIFFLLGFCFVFSEIRAQDYDYSSRQHSHEYFDHVRFGVFFAPNISWMHPTSSKSDDKAFAVSSDGSKPGYSWGLMADYFFQQNYGLSLGFQLNTTGGKINTSSLADTQIAGSVSKTAFNYTAQYLEIPFALKLRSDEISGFRFFGQIGLSLGINISKKASYKVNYIDEHGAAKLAEGDNEKLTGSFSMAPVMMQLNVGAGIEYPISGKLNFYTGIFFNNGFLPDATDPEKYKLGYSGSFSDGNIRLNNFALRVGLFF